MASEHEVLQQNKTRQTGPCSELSSLTFFTRVCAYGSEVRTQSSLYLAPFFDSGSFRSSKEGAEPGHLRRENLLGGGPATFPPLPTAATEGLRAPLGGLLRMIGGDVGSGQVRARVPVAALARANGV